MTTVAFLRAHGWPMFTLLLTAQLVCVPSGASVKEGPQTEASQPEAEKARRPKPETQADGSTTNTPPGQKNRDAGEFVVAPLPISSPALGAGIVPVLGYIFPLRKRDRTSLPTIVGAAGLITDNGSRAFAVGGDSYFRENTYHATVAYGRGDLDYNLYGIGTAAGDAGFKLPLKQTGEFLFVQFLRRLVWSFSLGPRFFSGDSAITIRPGNRSPVPAPPDLALRTTLRSLGFHLQRDTRPNRFYPTTGMLLDFTGDFFTQSLGSKYSFQSYRFNFNKYGSLSKKQVLAYNLAVCGTGGKPPFYGNCIYGTNNQLRGYTAGRYLDRYMLSTQLEYRLELPLRFGAVVFGGVGEVVPGGDQLLRTKNFLPAGGGGVRFMLSKKYHVNLRADLAAGKESHTWAMGIGEAF